MILGMVVFTDYFLIPSMTLTVRVVRRNLFSILTTVLLDFGKPPIAYLKCECWKAVLGFFKGKSA